jgi:Ca2+-binding RTX toxin-like protein
MENRNKSLLPLLFLISSCAADDAPIDQLSRASPAEMATEESPERDLSIDEEEIEIIYREATSSLEVAVNVEKLTRMAGGSTIEMQVEVTTPDGATTRHDFSWTNGEDRVIPRIEAPVLHNGLYEVVVTELAIDGRMLDGSFMRQRMDVRGDRDPQESHQDGGGGWDDDDDDDGGHDGWDDDDDGDHDGGDWDDDDDGGHDGGDWDDDDDGGWDDDGGHGGDKCKRGKKKHGGDSNDKLRGTERNDLLYGHDGRDKLWGYECHDSLYGGDGRDTLKGGKGRDFLHGGKGEDTCEGGQGKDEYRSCERIN